MFANDVKNVKNTLLNTLIIILIILNSGYAMVTMYKYTIYINCILCIILLPNIINFLKNAKIDITVFAFFSLIFMVISTYIINGFKDTNTYIIYIMNIIIGFGVCITYSFNDIKKTYLKIITIISIVSIFGYYLANFTNIIQSLPTKVNTNGIVYNIAYVFFSITIIPSRNCGIFWEPGLYACFLILALLFEITFKKDKINLLKVALFIICILTTKSATGYALLLLIVALLITKYIKDNNKKTIKIILVTLLTLILLFIFHTNIYTIFKDNIILNRLEVENLKEETRYKAIRKNINGFLESSIGGQGVSKARGETEAYIDTSTSTYFLNVFGILGVLYTFYWIYAICNLKELNILSRLFFMIIILVILNVQPHRQILFTWCLLFILLKKSKKEIKDESKK